MWNREKKCLQTVDSVRVPIANRWHAPIGIIRRGSNKWTIYQGAGAVQRNHRNYHQSPELEIAKLLPSPGLNWGKKYGFWKSKREPCMESCLVKRWSFCGGNGTELTELSLLPLIFSSRLLTVSSLELKRTSWYIVHIGQTPWKRNKWEGQSANLKEYKGMRWSVNKGRNARERAKRERDINFRIRNKKVLT